MAKLDEIMVDWPIEKTGQHFKAKLSDLPTESVQALINKARRLVTDAIGGEKVTADKAKAKADAIWKRVLDGTIRVHEGARGTVDPALAEAKATLWQARATLEGPKLDSKALAAIRDRDALAAACKARGIDAQALVAQATERIASRALPTVTVTRKANGNTKRTRSK